MLLLWLVERPNMMAQVVCTIQVVNFAGQELDAPEMEQVFIFLENSCRDQNGRQAIASMLLDKARLGDDGVEVSEDRDRRNVVIVGALFMRLPATKYKDLMRMVQQIDAGVPARNSGYIERSIHMDGHDLRRFSAKEISLALSCKLILEVVTCAP